MKTWAGKAIPQRHWCRTPPHAFVCTYSNGRIQIIRSSMIPTKALSGYLKFYFKHAVIMYKFLLKHSLQERNFWDLGSRPSVWESWTLFTELPEDPSLSYWSVKQLLGEKNYPPSTDLSGLWSSLRTVQSSGLQTSLDYGASYLEAVQNLKKAIL